MHRAFIALASLATATLYATGPSDAQNATIFDQQSICDSKTNFVDKKKLFAVALNSASKAPGGGISRVLNADGSIDRNQLYLANGEHFDYFKEAFLDDPKSSYFEVVKGKNFIKTGKDLVDHPEAYEIRCKISQQATLRSQVDNFTKQLASKIAVGKDLDALTKSVSQRNPAKLSVTRDGIAGNTAFQTEAAIAGYFNNAVTVNDPSWTGGSSQTIFIDFYPFVTFQTVSNSKPSLKDTEKTSLGAMLVTDNVPFFGLGANHFSYRVAHQLDTSKSYEINMAEVVWTPDFGPFRALGFGRTQFPSGPDGLWYRYAISARARTGYIIENDQISTLPKNGDFTRAGFKAELYTGASGSDFFSKFSTSLSYQYFDNLHGGNGIDHFYKFSAGLQYDLTDNYGIGITYTRGRDEDLLTEINQIIAALTIKFGGKIAPAP